MRAGARRFHAGFAIYAVVLLLLLGVTSVGLTFYRPSPEMQAARTRSADAFAQVKAALIGYASRHGVFQCSNPADAAACQSELDNSSKLGELPCPDIDDDGDAEAACTNAWQRLGRVPWKTLGIPPPVDESGETLWYAVSLRFLGNASNPIVKTSGRTSSGAINSSTPGDLTILGANKSAIASTAVAVLLAPGPLLGGKSRSRTQTENCGSLGTIAQSLCPANYLDVQASIDNATGASGFIAGTPGPAFNDRVAYVLPSELIPVLEMRLGNELRSLLLQYKYNSKCFCYPWADSWAYSGGIGDFGVNRGRLASTANNDSTPGAGDPENWGTGNIPRFPQWVFDNDWHNLVYYIASRAETHKGRGGCLTCSSLDYIEVQRTTAAGSPVDLAAAVLITPGTPRPGITRPYLPYALNSNLTAANDFSAYFEDALNRKSGCLGQTVEHASSPPTSLGSTALDCDKLVRPTSRAPDRDRLFILKRDVDDLDMLCRYGGPALFSATPCHDPHGADQLSAACNNLIPKLKLCVAGCAEAAGQMADEPCRNNRTSSHCPPHHAALLSCRAP